MHNLHIFDCDGVLLDSNTAKMHALRNVFITIGAPISFVNWAVEEFRSNFGRTRSQHFDVFKLKSNEKGFQFSSEKLNQAIRLYGESVELLYQNCNIINETLTFILRLCSNEQIFVVSASDQAELREVLPSRIPIIKKEHVFGGPSSKLKNISHILKITGAKNAIFYGDAVQDARASVAAGVSFIGLTKYAADYKALKLFCANNNLKCMKSLPEEISL
jgi:beta-phosphoglucomutase-like phosphatase (HAD superfamily)